MKKLYINPVTRTIAPKYRGQKAVYIAKKDHNSVLLGFEIPKIVDGYDISAVGNIIHIHYANISYDETSVSRGMSEAVNITVDDEEGIVTFGWRVPKTATRYAGVVSIGITIERYEDVDGTPQEVYSWSTAPYGNTIVQDSMDNSDEVCEKDFDYLVETCNAIVELALKGKITEAIETIDNKLTEAEAEINQIAEEVRKNSKTAEEMALEAESWATGNTGSREGEDTDNALHYCDKALEYASNAESSANASKASANASKASANASEASANASEASANASAEFAENAKNSAKDVDVTKNDTWQYRVEAEQYALQAKESAETINPIYSNALRGKVIGTNVVRLDDVSPLRQNIDLTTDKQTAFKSYGKNIFKYNPDEWTATTDTDGSTRYTIPLNLPTTTITMCGVFASEVIPKGYVYVEKSNDGWKTKSYANTSRYGIWVENIAYGVNNPNLFTFTVEEGYEYRLWTNSASTVEIIRTSLEDILTEVGNKLTEYEPFKEPINDVVSVHPTTTLIADTIGVEITAEYNRDINRVIAKLEQAIANL